MSRESVFCLAFSPDLADQIVSRVRTAGYSSQDVSALFPSQISTPDREPEQAAGSNRRKQPEPTQSTAWQTARRSGFSCIGALTIPGAGAFVAAGPIIFALSQGLAAALTSMGVSEFAASRYAGKIKEGNILILIQSDNLSGIDVAKTIFRETGALCIHTAHEASGNLNQTTPTLQL